MNRKRRGDAYVYKVYKIDMLNEKYSFHDTIFENSLIDSGC